MTSLLLKNLKTNKIIKKYELKIKDYENMGKIFIKAYNNIDGNYYISITQNKEELINELINFCEKTKTNELVNKLKEVEPKENTIILMIRNDKYLDILTVDSMLQAYKYIVNQLLFYQKIEEYSFEIDNKELLISLYNNRGDYSEMSFL